jgi:hypothetical protein
MQNNKRLVKADSISMSGHKQAVEINGDWENIILEEGFV